MEYRSTGRTGIELSALGFGAGHIGASDRSEKEVNALLGHLLDQGVTFWDTARGYGLSEERIGKFLHGQRQKAVLCTKVGYGVEGIPDWTYDCVVRGVERALGVLKSDYLDIVLLHTCPASTLERYDVVHALLNVKQRGLVRAIGYSGDNDDLAFALGLADLDVFEGSVNLFDQDKIPLLPQVKADGRGFIAKRPLGNAPWRFDQRPVGNYAETYWERMTTMGLLNEKGFQRGNTALRFAAFTPGVTSAIAGTGNQAHFDEQLAWLNDGPLAPAEYEHYRDLFRTHGRDWRSEV
ncbi:MAG: aldo/keto reductase [Spirochaetales bacterium]|nr:aldo/keto reductase [Spirochaetales bacterium]